MLITNKGGKCYMYRKRRAHVYQVSFDNAEWFLSYEIRSTFCDDADANTPTLFLLKTYELIRMVYINYSETDGVCVKWKLKIHRKTYFREIHIKLCQDLTLSHVQKICSRQLWIHLCKTKENLYKWSFYYLIVWKHCG